MVILPLHINSLRLKVLQQPFHSLFYHLDILCGFVTFYYVAVAVDEEFGEIPLDVGILVVVGISLREHIDEDFAYLMVGVNWQN